MVHGDALITQRLQQSAPEDLLLEIQGGLDQLSAYTTRSHSSMHAHPNATEDPVTDTLPTLTAQNTMSSTTVPDSLILSTVRPRKPADAHLLRPQQGMPRSAHDATNSSQSTPLELFQSPDFPCMQQASPNEAHSATVESMSAANDWAGVQPELLSQVLQQVQWSSKEAVALTGICR